MVLHHCSRFHVDSDFKCSYTLTFWLVSSFQMYPMISVYASYERILYAESSHTTVLGSCLLILLAEVHRSLYATLL